MKAFVIEKMDEQEWYPKKYFTTKKEAIKRKEKYNKNYQKYLEKTYPEGHIMRNPLLQEKLYRVRKVKVQLKKVM